MKNDMYELLNFFQIILPHILDLGPIKNVHIKASFIHIFGNLMHFIYIIFWLADFFMEQKNPLLRVTCSFLNKCWAVL